MGVKAAGPNDGITLANIRNGNAYYSYDQYNIASDGVKAVQRALHMYGYNLNGAADGKFGSITRAIVKGFQTENGLTVNGLVDQATLAKLEAWSGTLYETPTATPLLKTVEYGLDYLHSGDNGAAVFSVRGFLKNQGYNCESVGSYDSTIISLVKQFQTKKGLTATGNVDQITLAMLEDATADTAWLSGSTVNLTAGKLAKAGFIEILLRPDVVADINKGLNKYGITTGEKVLHFLSQVMEETQSGEELMENNYKPGEGIAGKTYTPFAGAGVLQLTNAGTYQDFSAHVNTSANGYTADNKIYIADGDNTYSTQHVALKYPGTSAGWFWDRVKECNTKIGWTSEGAQSISEKLTLKIKGDANTEDMNNRYLHYLEIKSKLPYNG